MDYNNHYNQLYDLIMSIKQWKSFQLTDNCLDLYEQTLEMMENIAKQLIAIKSSVILETFQELIQIMDSKHIQLLFECHDIIVSELKKLNHLENCEYDSNCQTYDHNNWFCNESNQSDQTITRYRLVKFDKNSDEPMGITIKLDEFGRCVVSRIMHGGFIHRQSTLHSGDIICKINDIPVYNLSVENIQKMLRDAKGSVSFKILPGSRSPQTYCKIYVRTQFNYNPEDDELIPSINAGLAFNVGDILEVICKEDNYWWQSRREGDKGAAGLIPSPELVEWRTTNRQLKNSKKPHKNCISFGKKKKKHLNKYLAKRNALFDELDIATYEEVVFMPFIRKTLVLLGAHGIGRRHIKNTLISNYADKFAYPIPHTTRYPRKGEENGKHYFFISQQQMLEEIALNEFLEYGTHDNDMYGIKISTIKQIIYQEKIPILDVEPQALKVLRTAEFAPFVVYIATPSIIDTENTEKCLQRLSAESDLLQHSFCHLFDLTIVNNDIEETVLLVENAFKHINSSSQWIPLSWIY